MASSIPFAVKTSRSIGVSGNEVHSSPEGHRRQTAVDRYRPEPRSSSGLIDVLPIAYVQDVRSRPAARRGGGRFCRRDGYRSSRRLLPIGRCERLRDRRPVRPPHRRRPGRAGNEPPRRCRRKHRTRYISDINDNHWLPGRSRSPRSHSPPPRMCHPAKKSVLRPASRASSSARSIARVRSPFVVTTTAALLRRPMVEIRPRR